MNITWPLLSLSRQLTFLLFPWSNWLFFFLTYVHYIFAWVLFWTFGNSYSSKNKKRLLNTESHCFEWSSYTRPKQTRLKVKMESPRWNEAVCLTWQIKIRALTVTFPNRSDPVCATMELLDSASALSSHRRITSRNLSAKQLPFYCSFLCPHSFKGLTLKWPICFRVFLSPSISFSASKKKSKAGASCSPSGPLSQLMDLNGKVKRWRVLSKLLPFCHLTLEIMSAVVKPCRIIPRVSLLCRPSGPTHILEIRLL